MNSNDEDLENEIGSIPLPHPSRDLDERVMNFLQHHKASLKSLPGAVSHERTKEAATRTKRRRILQVLAIFLLCFSSFAAGRSFESIEQSNYASRIATTPEPAKTQTSKDIEQAMIEVASNFPVEPSAESSFRDLVVADQTLETIWGPTDQLSWKWIEAQR
jgi:hypothetical protein